MPFEPHEHINDERGKDILGGNYGHTQGSTDLKIEFIDWIVENLKEPSLFPQESSNSSLSETFNIENSDTCNKTAITYAVLNYNIYKQDVKPFTRFEFFFDRIREYVPERFKSIKTCKTSNQMNASQQLLDAYEKFNLWFSNFKSKIEDYLSSRYFMSGKMNYLEILKRRYSKNWSEAKIVDLDANVNGKIDSDLTLNIKFEEV